MIYYNYCYYYCREEDYDFLYAGLSACLYVSLSVSNVHDTSENYEYR